MLVVVVAVAVAVVVVAVVVLARSNASVRGAEWPSRLLPLLICADWLSAGVGELPIMLAVP